MHPEKKRGKWNFPPRKQFMQCYSSPRPWFYFLHIKDEFKFTVCDMHKHHPVVPFRISTTCNLYTLYIIHWNTLFNTWNTLIQQVCVSLRFIIYRSTLWKLGHVPPEWVYQTRTLLNRHSSLSIFRPECTHQQTRHTSLNLSSSLTHRVSPTSYLLYCSFSPGGKGLKKKKR